jgi:hypothetical protein
VTYLLNILKDRSKLALLAFLIPVVEQAEKINMMFQVGLVMFVY